MLGYTSLIHAAADGHVDIVRHLLDNKKASVDAFDDVHQNTALHEASWKGYSQTIELLCKHKANPYLKNKQGHTALHLACQQGHNQSCRILLLNGCKPDVKNNFGDTPLHSAARYGHAGVVRILLSAFCNVNDVNKNGDTALHISAAMGRKKLTRILLEAGANPAVQNKQGETAMSICIRKGYTDVQEIIANPPPLKPPTVQTKASEAVKTPKREKDSSQESKSSEKGRLKKTRSGSSRSVHFTPDGKIQSKTKKTPKLKNRLSGSCDWSPYGCHMHPDANDFPKPNLDSLPNDPLTKGEQYYIDLAGNICKGPVGVSNKCFCKPLIKDMEKKMEKDKQELIEHIDFAHENLTEKISSLEKKTHNQLVSLNEVVSQKLAHEKLECNERVQRCALKERIESQRRQRLHMESLKGEVKTWLNSKLDSHRRSCNEHLDQSRDTNNQNHNPYSYQRQMQTNHNPYYNYHQNYGQLQRLERTTSHANVQSDQYGSNHQINQISRPNSNEEVLNDCVNSSQPKRHLKPIPRSKSDMYLTISAVSESEDEEEEDEDKDEGHGDEEESEEKINGVSDDSIRQTVPKVESSDESTIRRSDYGLKADNSESDLQRLGARPKEPLRIRTSNETLNEVTNISDQNSGSSLEMSSNTINNAINQSTSHQPIRTSDPQLVQVIADVHLSADLMKTLRCNGSVTVGEGSGDPSADSPFNDSGYRTKFSPSPREVPLLTTTTATHPHNSHINYAQIYHPSVQQFQQRTPYQSQYQTSLYSAIDPPIGLPSRPQPMRKLSLTGGHYNRTYNGPNSSLV